MQTKRLYRICTAKRTSLRNVGARWARHVRRRWKKDSDASANALYSGKGSVSWTGPDAANLVRTAKILGSFDGCCKHNPGDGALGWNMWVDHVFHEPRFVLIACGRRPLYNTTNMEAEILTANDLIREYCKLLS